MSTVREGEHVTAISSQSIMLKKPETTPKNLAVIATASAFSGSPRRRAVRGIPVLAIFQIEGGGVTTAQEEANSRRKRGTTSGLI